MVNAEKLIKLFVLMLDFFEILKYINIFNSMP
jgi:hypothetical protein